MKSHPILAIGIASLFIAHSLSAATFTWDGGGVNDNIAAANNWSTNIAPGSDLVNTDLIFDGLVRLTPNFSAVFSANSLVFNSNAAANGFTFGGSVLTIGAGGIVNGDADTQTFGNQVTIGTANSIFDALSSQLVLNGTVALGANALAVKGNSVTFAGPLTGTGTITKSTTGAFNLNATATAIGADLNLTGGTTTLVATGATQTFSSTSTVALSGTGTFAINENLILDGAQLTRATGAAVTIATGKTLMIQSGGDAVITGAFTQNTASTIAVTGAGSTFSATGNIALNGGSATNILAGGGLSAGVSAVAVASGTSGTLTVDGSGSNVTAGTFLVAQSGATGSAAFTNGSSGALGLIFVGGGTSAGTNGTLAIQSGATVTGTSVQIANGVGTVTGSLTINGAGSALNLSSASASNIGAASASTGTLNVQNGGVFSSSTGLLTVNTTGAVAITGGTFNANGDMALSGQLTRDASGVFNLAAGKTLTVQNGGDAIFTGGANFATAATTTVTGTGSTLSSATSGFLRFQGGSTLNVLAGADVSAPFGFEAGTAGGATVLVDGAGSTLDATGISTVHKLGVGATATMTLSNAAHGAFDFQLDVANSASPGSVANVLVNSGATVTSGGIFIATLGGAGNSGSITVDGAGSTWQIAPGTLQIGAASGSTGSLTVSNGGTFTTSTIGPQIQPTGSVNVNGGTLNVNGDMTVNGGQFTQSTTGIFVLDGGTSTASTGRSVRVQAGGTATFNNNARFAIAFNPVTVTGVGSLLSAPGTADILINGASSYSVLLGGAVSTGRFIDIGTSGTSTTSSLLVDGAGSSVTTSSALSSWGGNTAAGGNAVVTFQNNAAGTIGAVNLGVSTTSGSTGTLLIASDADVTMGTLAIASSAAATTGTATITGAGTTLTLNSGAALTLGATSASTGTLNVNDGAVFTASTAGVTLNATGRLNIGGGTVTLPGPITRAGGTVNFTSGTLNILGNWNIGPGGLLGSNVTFDPTHRFVTTGTTTIDDLNTLTINGGILSTGGLIINGNLAFNTGTLAITGAGGFNIGTGGLGSQVTLQAGRTLQVINTTTINSGALLRLDGGSFSGGAITNNGTIDHADGVLNFTGTLTNNAAGRLFVGGLASPDGAITNAGRITMQNGVGFLGGAGAITNTGIITGDGTIAKPVTSSGTGELRAEAGKTLLFTGVNGTNTGKLNLQGGSIEFSQALTNGATGVMQGRGTANFIGGLTNQGAMSFSAGTTDIFGIVNMTGGAGGSARVISSGGGTTTFYNSFTHNGAEVRASDNSTVVFFGAVNGAGPFTGSGTVSLEGSYNPGNSPALVTIEPKFVFNGGSLQIMEIFGAQPGDNNGGLLDGYDKLVFNSPNAVQVQWGGTLEINLGNNFYPLDGMIFDLFDFDNTRDQGAFSTIAVNDPGNLLDPMLTLDFSNLYVDGTVSVAPVPEPAAAFLIILGGMAVVGRRRSRY